MEYQKYELRYYYLRNGAKTNKKAQTLASRAFEIQTPRRPTQLLGGIRAGTKVSQKLCLFLQPSWVHREHAGTPAVLAPIVVISAGSQAIAVC